MQNGNTINNMASLPSIFPNQIMSLSRLRKDWAGEEEYPGKLLPANRNTKRILLEFPGILPKSWMTR
jgi:hypothetical protein